MTAQTSQLREQAERLEQRNHELEEAHKSLREASLTDPLTGLSNRRVLSECLGHDVARVLRPLQTIEKYNIPAQCIQRSFATTWIHAQYAG